MISVRRLFLAGLTLAFGGFNAVLALLRLDRYHDAWTTIWICLTYMAALTLCTIGFKKFELPVWAAWLVSLVAVLLPIATHLSHRGKTIDTYDTWYVTAVGLLLGALAVRARTYFAIISAVIFSAEVLYFGGLDYLPKSGLSGAIILIIACIAVSGGLKSAAKEIAAAQVLAAEERAALEIEKTSAQANEIASKVALNSVMPILKKIASGKNFSREQRERYQLSEISLRDDISGGRLVNKKLKRAVAAARNRGVDIALLDEGGIETVPQEELDQIIDLIVAALSEVNSGRVTIRTQPEENWLIRMTASRPRVVTPDLDLKLGER